MSVGAGQAFADQPILARSNLADTQARLLLAEGLQLGRHSIGQDEVGGAERIARALQGEDDAAGEDFLGEGFAQELVAAHAVAAGRQKVDVVVLGLAFPARRGEADEEGGRDPQAYDFPGMIHPQAAEKIEHARHPSMNGFAAVRCVRAPRLFCNGNAAP